MESIIKGPRASRSVVGTLYDPSSNGNRRRRYPEGICPEPTRLLHVRLLSHGFAEGKPVRDKYKSLAFRSARGEVPPEGTRLSWPG